MLIYQLVRNYGNFLKCRTLKRALSSLGYQSLAIHSEFILVYACYCKKKLNLFHAHTNTPDSLQPTP